MTAVVELAAVGRQYPGGVVALRDVDLRIDYGELVGVVGPSGSGKSTLLHLMGGLDDPTVGAVSWPGIGPRSGLRPGPVAVIFQGPSLLPPLTVEENVALPLILGAAAHGPAHIAARAALERLELLELADKLPEEISGGQAQRVAVARALAGEPSLILADEPTGQLDRASGAIVVDVLLAAAAHAGAALVVATHDPTVAARLPDVWEMHGGRLTTTRPKEAAWSR